MQPASSIFQIFLLLDILLVILILTVNNKLRIIYIKYCTYMKLTCSKRGLLVGNAHEGQFMSFL